MSGRPVLLLSFAWGIPASDAQAERMFAAEGLGPLPEPLRALWSAAERFLATSGELPDRRLLTGKDGGDPLSARLGEKTVSFRTVLARHPASHAITLIVFATVTATRPDSHAGDVDLAIALLQSLQGREGEGENGLCGWWGERKFPSVRKAVKHAFGELTDIELERKAWCVELRTYDGWPASAAVDADPRPYYGLATSDEGWRFVAPDVARTALGPVWGTRTFVASYAMAGGIVTFNSKGEEYVHDQRELAVRLFGAEQPYFGIDAPVAGLDHGSLFILERVLVRMALADQWLRRAQADGGVNRTQLLRGSLDDNLEMFYSGLPPEVDSLERQLVQSMGIERVLQQLDRQAEVMDEETRYSYENTVSARVTRLTVITVVLTVVTIVLGLLQVLVSW